MTEPTLSGSTVALLFDAGIHAAVEHHRKRVLRWIVWDSPMQSDDQPGGLRPPLGESRAEGFLTEEGVCADYERHRQPGWPDLKRV